MAEPFKPFLFLRRGRVWTIVYPGPGGGKKQKATSCRGPEEEGKAKRILAEFTRRREAAATLEGDDETGPMTFARWAKQWLATKQGKKIAGTYEQRLRDYILPLIGAKRLDAVTGDDVAAILRGAGRLAPRTQRHVFYTLNPIFRAAIRRGLLDTNPCGKIAEEDMPQKKDAVPGWRRKAQFTRAEVVLLLTSPLVPYDRRVFYSALFLAGCRFGEISALLVDDYQPEMLPLAQLAVERSYDSDEGTIGPTKTDNPRLVPVHPWLKSILDEWLATGWEQLMGRPWRKGDILIPSRRNTYRSRSTMWQALNGRPARTAEPERNRKARAAVPGDLERLGLRNRRQHDARRTFITLCRADGADKDLLHLVTHGPEGDIMDIYTETEVLWPALCAEVGKLKLAPPLAPVPTPAAPPASPANPAISRVAGLPLGCHAENPQLASMTYAVTPPGIENPADARQPLIGGDSDGQTAERRHFEPGAEAADAATGGPAAPMATLATLALRQALAALDRGRLDHVREILERALEAERGEGEGVAVGGGRR